MVDKQYGITVGVYVGVKVCWQYGDQPRAPHYILYYSHISRFYLFKILPDLHIASQSTNLASTLYVIHLPTFEAS